MPNSIMHKIEIKLLKIKAEARNKHDNNVPIQFPGHYHPVIAIWPL